MEKISLIGSYYEIGIFYGKLLNNYGFNLKSIPQKRVDFAVKTIEQIESFYPEILDEIKGLSEATTIDFDQLCGFLFVLPEKEIGCTNFAVTDGNQTFLGRNYDWYYSKKKHARSFYTNASGSFGNIGQSTIFLGREDGMNEQGLAVAMNGIFGSRGPGIPFWIAIRYLLDKCSNVNNAVDFLTSITHHRTTNFILTDTKGEMAVVEASPKQVEVREPMHNCIVSTNHFQHSKMKYQKYRIVPNSKKRYMFTKSILIDREENLTSEFLEGILSNHSSEICNHNRRIGTLWSAIYNTTTKQIWRADGFPCKTLYEKDNRLLVRSSGD